MSKFLKCGHHGSLLMVSAETGAPLYCELCDLRTQYNDLLTDLARVTEERDAMLVAACTAYGHLWHVNNEPMAPIPTYTPEKAAYAARKVLRDLLTSEQRGDAINATQHVWGDASRKEKS